MRRFLISILLASAAASPAFAQDQNDGRPHHAQQQNDDGQAREERQQAREQARAERTNNQRQQGQGEARGFDRPHFDRGNMGQPAQVPQEAHVRVDRGGNGFSAGQQGQAPAEQVERRNWNGGRGFRGENGFSGAQQAPVGQVERRNWNGGRGYRGENGFSGGQQVPVDQVDRRNWNGNRENWRRNGGEANVARTRGPLVVSTVPREGTQPPPRIGDPRWAGASSNWNRGWRDNHRYDWRDWRSSHRTIFHIGIYYDPFGWDYRPYQIGWRLWPNYYSQRFWINDPWMYRLPYAPPGLVWVRYWDDALLVDTYSGEVVDVIHNFFW